MIDFDFNPVLGIEDEIHRGFRFAIARGIHRPGEILPSPDIVGRERLVAPKKVDRAYRRLAEEELVLFMDGHGYMIVKEAPERARALLVEELRESLARAIRVLINSGCARADVESALLATIDEVAASEKENT